MIEWFSGSWLSFALIMLGVLAFVLQKLTHFVSHFNTDENTPKGISMAQISTDFNNALRSLSYAATNQYNITANGTIDPHLLEDFINHGQLYRQQYSRTLDDATAQLIDGLLEEAKQLQQSNPEDLKPEAWESLSLNTQRLLQRMDSEQ
jgi:hypothetical protein